MRNGASKFYLSTLFGFLLTILCSTSAQAIVRATYLYNLSSFTGTIPYNWVRPFVDRERNEIYVANGQDQSVRIFNENGMEIYNFGDDENLRGMLDGAVDGQGNIYILTIKYDNGLPRNEIVRCNFRGEPTSAIEVKDLPPEFSTSAIHRLVYMKGSLYLANLVSKQIVVTDEEGHFKKGYNIAKILNLTEKEKDELNIVGFSVAPDGSIFFTIPVLFTAYKLSPDGEAQPFGRKGSAPGKFNIIAGIASDDRGYIYVVDKLRSVVMIFDKEFRFQSEFGYRGRRPGNLIAPNQLEVDGKGRVYVTQSARRGVSVFQVKYD
jgi:DNA-binding beta-propeller fold protein YncE